MFRERHERKEEAHAEEMQREQAAAATDATQTDDAEFDPNEKLEESEERDDKLLGRD